MRGRSLFHRKISIASTLVIFLATSVFGVSLLLPRAALAIPVEDSVNLTPNTATAINTVNIAGTSLTTSLNTTSLNTQEAKKSAGNLLRISLTNTAAVAVLNGLNYFAQKVAYDTAVYVASGGKGQVPLIFDQPGEYLKKVGADAAGEVLGTLTKDPATFGKYGVNLCAPTMPRIALNLKLGFLASLPSFGVGHAPTPKCTWDSISSNWDTFTNQNTAQVLDNVGAMFSPGQSSLGAAIEVNNVALKEINARKYTAGIEQAIGNGFKPIVDKISGKLKTPASTVKKTFEYSVDEGFKVKDNTTQITAGAFGAGALGVLTASLKTFAGVLTDKMTKKIFEKGFISVSDLLGLNSGPGGPETALTFDGAPPLAGRAGAELANASLLTPNILSVSSYNELLEFASCPEEGRTASNCVIDQQFFGALSRVEQGVTVTLRQGIQQGFLNRNWQLLPLAHQKNLSGNCHNEAFCYSNLVKLRRARIIPIGWELAANSEFNDVSRPVTLGEAMDRFNDCPTMEDADGNTVVDESKLPDPLHPWCHLIDPEWVLKYPASSCRQRGPGPTLVSPQSSSRAAICVDVATCVAEDASGNCVGGYGYCVREKSVWKMDADACPAQYASCTTYQRASGGSFSYLANTLDGAACNSENAGCRRYSLSPNSVPNPGFEDALDDAPRDWNLSAAARYHVGGRLSMRGSSTVGISGASTATTRISGLMPGLEYRLSASVLQEIENTSGIGTVTVSFLDDHGVALPPAPITSTCRSMAPSMGVALDVASTSLGYLTGSCKVTLPVGAVAADVTLSTDAPVGNRTWFDEIGFFGESFSDSPFDAVFMNGKAEKCAADQAGCSQFMRLATGTLNMLRNPSFETVDVDVPAFWEDAVAGRYENATLVGQEGLSAYALSTSPISQTVDGIMASAAYTFSINSRRDGTGSTAGTARIQLYDSSRPPVPVSPTTVGGDCATSGSAIVVDLANGADYASSSCVFTTPEEAGSLVVSLSAGANSPRILADAAQLELSVNATPFHTGYGVTTERVFLKKPPEGLNCTGSNPPPECEKFAPSCRREEVGCNLYQPVDGGAAIPAVTTDADICPAACAGYDTFRQEPSNFSDQRFPLFLIPKSAQACTAAEAGCSEFTNIERLAQGGESREYYSYLRLCAAPGPRSGTYYTWEGNDVRGFQLRTWALLRSNIEDATVTSADPTGGNAPCSKLAYGASGQAICADDAASVAAASCVKGLVGINPDCREFYDELGNIHYRLYSKTIVSTDDCKQYRITRTTQSECEDHGGLYRNGECRYSSYAAESVACRQEAAGCRAYSGNASRNVRIAFTSTFEGGTTDEWTVPAGEDTNDAINSTEAVSQGGHSLKVSRADIYRDVEDAITVGHQYILTFWAKGTGDISARLSHAAAGSFTLDRVTGEDVPVALTTEWRPYQIGPVEAVNTPEEGEQLIIVSSGVASPLFYLDNIELREVTENIFLIEDSWKTPSVCDESPTGDPSPQYMLGCRSYTDKDKLLKNFKSFEKLCREEAVGCEALFDTRNSDSPFAQSFNAICTLPDADADGVADACTTLSCPCVAQGKNVCEVVIGFNSCRYDADQAVPAANVSSTGDTARVPADGIVYMVNDPQFRCESTNMGCTELGDRTLNPDRLAVQSWAPKLLKNLPSTYSTTLCKSSEEFCQAYTRRADGAQVYFKDPDTRICTFSEGTLTSSVGVNGNGWFRKDSNQPCDPEFLEAGTRFGIWKNSDARYEGWAGVCSPQFDMCKEFIDPEDQSSGYGAGKPYYAIMNDRLDTKTCAGRVSLQTSPTDANDASACVLFWRTDDLHKIYDAKATYEASERANGALVTPVSSGVDDTANIIIKVKRDRQCGEWLDCRSSETIFNPSTGGYQNVCTAFSLCAEYERIGSTTRCIRYVESSYAGKTLTEGIYESRDVSWEGMEYSGYGIPNRYPVEELVTVNVGPSASQPELRLVRSIGACSQAYGAPCGPAGDQGTCLGPSPRVCVYPIDGGRRVTSLAELRQVQNTNGYPSTSCRVYPQESAPFPSTAADPTGWDQSVADDNNGNPVLIGPSPGFAAANICQRRLVDGVEVSSCECNYFIAKYGSTIKYLPPGGADMPQGYCQAGPYENYECDPLASGARTRTNLSCCTTNPAEDTFGISAASDCDDSARCLTLTKVDRVVGYEGQCLERDFTTPINGRADEFACVTWRPVNLIGGSRDIYNQNQTAGYFAPADRRFYCVGNKPAWSIILNIDPSVPVTQQPMNQFFGEGTYNNRVDNYASQGGNCSNDADGAGSTRWCIYPGVSTLKNVSNNADAVFRYVVDGNPIGMLGCYEVSDPNNDVITTAAVGPAQIVWPYIGPPIYRDQLESIFFQVTDDIYHFDIDTDPSDTDPGPGYGDATPYLNGAADDVPPEDDDGGVDNEYDFKSYTSNTSAYKIIIHDDPNVDDAPFYESIPTNPYQNIFADCNDDGDDNIDSSNDDNNDSAPFTEADTADPTRTGLKGLYFITEANKWQIDASDSEGKIGFNARFDANGRLKSIVLQAEADSGENGEGTFGINSMGFRFKQGCEQVARVDVPGEYGLTKAYTNTLNPARNFRRVESDPPKFEDVIPYGFTSYSQACVAYGSIGTISANPPTKPWTYVASIPRFITTTDPATGVTTTVPSDSGIELPLQCTTLSQRTGSRYQKTDTSETLRKIFRKITGFWNYTEIAQKGQLLVDKVASTFITAKRKDERIYLPDSTNIDDTGALSTFSTGFNGGVVPPRVASLDTSTCDTNGRCGTGKVDSITLSGKQQGLLLGADGAMNVSARFFAWASHNAMPIIRRTVFWGDFTPNEPPAKGWYKNQKPFCSPDVSDENAVGECNGLPGLTCNINTDCPGDVACNHGANAFGNSPGACNATPYQFDHTYVCSLSALNAMPLCTGPSAAADNAPCYRMVSDSPVCVYRPKVQIVDNWGWCNCTGSGCRVPGGAYSSDGPGIDGCNPVGAPANAEPWTEFEGEVRLAPTFEDAQAFTPGGGGGGGGGGSGAGGIAVNDSYTANLGQVIVGFGSGLLPNDTLTGPESSRVVQLVRAPFNGSLTPLIMPDGTTAPISPSGGFSYIGNNGFHGIDSFEYRIIQDGAESNVATVTISIP